MKQSQKILATIAVAAFSGALILSVIAPSNEDQVSLDPQQSDAVVDSTAFNSLVEVEQTVTVTDAIESIEAAVEPSPIRVHYFVKVGDTLSGVFSSLGISYQDLQEILIADQVPLQLDTIKPGDHLEFVLEPETKQLSRLVFNISLVEQADYVREEDGKFEYTFLEQEGEWRERHYSGEIRGNFSLSAHQAGLSSNHIGNIARILRDKIDFARTLRAGDRFDVLVREQFLGDHPTGNREIQAVSFELSNGIVSAFLARTVDSMIAKVIV